jgi:hypothetical protein
MGYRSCLALLRDAKTYGNERTDAACRRALAIGSPTRKSVLAILKTGLDRTPLEPEQADLPMVVHDNVRGPDYYTTTPEHGNQRKENDKR